MLEPTLGATVPTSDVEHAGGYPQYMSVRRAAPGRGIAVSGDFACDLIASVGPRPEYHFLYQLYHEGPGRLLLGSCFRVVCSAQLLATSNQSDLPCLIEQSIESLHVFFILLFPF